VCTPTNTKGGFQHPGSATPTVQRDDQDVKITRWDFEPGSVTGWRRHRWPYFVMMLTDGLMRIHDGSQVTEFQRLAGDAYNRAAGVEHDVMNGSDRPMAFIEIEVKHPGALQFIAQ
jgi:beta-alanine degradation protein BauB